MTKNEILREFVRAEINFDSGKADYIDDTFTPVLDLVYKLVNKTNDIHDVSCFSENKVKQAYEDGQYDSEEGKGNNFNINNYR